MTTVVQTLAVAEDLSFHRAALALGTSRSSVSSRIKALENDLGISLFDRNTRGVRLTEAGPRFVDQVHDAIGILDRAIKAAGMQARGEEGELRIGVHALTAAASATACWHGSVGSIRAFAFTSPKEPRGMRN
ncbi:LysR family transcriptional regulator [Bradyrhizobium sp. LMG 9283]|uniref:LysR family transcriptional regulator n=1 Tax=Bradyrhizobium sp. LMG 9283 TaxID=592064 RepID=UPI00388FAC0D